ncbi:hypothetical protein NC652_037986 [Populus alba x Populus x berolinensis]|nr:hypothetical protein NC652_037986 [Populus alba x Populus x berolinensis]
MVAYLKYTRVHLPGGGVAATCKVALESKHGSECLFIRLRIYQVQKIEHPVPEIFKRAFITKTTITAEQNFKSQINS